MLHCGHSSARIVPMSDVTAHMSMNPKMPKLVDWIIPFTVGIVAFIATAKWGYLLTDFSKANGWKLDQIYTAGFGFLAVTTGFLATFYATLQSTAEGFVQKIRATKGGTLLKFLTLTKRAIILGFVVSLFSVPMMVVSPFPNGDVFSWPTIISSIWIGATVWAVASFYSVASMFFMLLETQVNPRRGAG